VEKRATVSPDISGVVNSHIAGMSVKESGLKSSAGQKFGSRFRPHQVGQKMRCRGRRLATCPYMPRLR